MEFAVAILYTLAWLALTAVLGVVALIRKTRASVALFGASAISLPAVVLVALASSGLSNSIRDFRRQSDAKTAQALCAEVEALPVTIVPPGGSTARVVLRPASAKERYFMPAPAAAVAQEFRESPRLCEQSRLVAIQDDLEIDDRGDGNKAPRASNQAEPFEICKTRPFGADGRPETTFALYFTLEKVVDLDAAGGAALRKFGMHLVDLTDMHVVKRSGVVTGPRLNHLPRACLDSAGQVSEFLRDALPR